MAIGGFTNGMYMSSETDAKGAYSKTFNFQSGIEATMSLKNSCNVRPVRSF
jgi:hypothetical protein